MKDKSVADGCTVKDITKLMKEMRECGISYLEIPGLKLSLSPQPSNKALPHTPTVGNAPVDQAKAFAHVEQARVEAAMQRREKLERLRRGAAASVGLNTEKLVADVFDASLETKGNKSS